MQPFNQKRPGGKRREEEILQLLEEFDYSDGMTVKEFSALHGISDGTLYYWRKRYAAKRVENGKSGGFIEILPSSANASAGLFAEIKGLKLFQAVSADYLKILIS
ncbi:MAG TPA: helix-turn-helix domain-containing protein [Puia sp.]|nr:helix-turn-helix domain-containing protein [Puia sp.]